MAAVEEGKCAVVVPPPPGFADRLFVLVLFLHPRFPLCPTPSSFMATIPGSTVY